MSTYNISNCNVYFCECTKQCRQLNFSSSNRYYTTGPCMSTGAYMSTGPCMTTGAYMSTGTYMSTGAYMSTGTYMSTGPVETLSTDLQNEENQCSNTENCVDCSCNGTNNSF